MGPFILFSLFFKFFFFFTLSAKKISTLVKQAVLKRTLNTTDATNTLIFLEHQLPQMQL